MPNTRTKKKPARRSTNNAPTQASQADKYVLYQRTVQEPEHEVEFFDRVYRKYIGGQPVQLREDFAGTFQVCCEWVKRRGERRALAVDNDAEPLSWGRAHNLAPLPPKQQEAITIHQGDVREVIEPKADVLAAQNFSFWCFKSRRELMGYFEAAYRNMADRSILVMDMMGGPECFEDERVDERKFKDFTYVWEQVSFEPISHTGRWQIHFRFPDGSEIRPAFTYDWRFWSLPEVREILEEVGFAATHVYWEGTDHETGEGNGVWRERKKAENDPAWIAYLIAVKG